MLKIEASFVIQFIQSGINGVHKHNVGYKIYLRGTSRQRHVRIMMRQSEPNGITRMKINTSDDCELFVK